MSMLHESVLSSLVHVYKAVVLLNSNNTPQSKHMHPRYGIVDSGNNKHHCFRDKSFFPHGVRWHDVKVQGISGTSIMRVGIGVAYFSTRCVDGKYKLWMEPNSIYNPKLEVNLLCHDRFHWSPGGKRTGHEIRYVNQVLNLSDKRQVPVVRDEVSHLPLMCIQPVSNNVVKKSIDLDRRLAASSTCESPDDVNDNTAFFQNTHLRPHNTTSVYKILGYPNERNFNLTVDKNMIDGLEGVRPLKQARAARPDAWAAGKMSTVRFRLPVDVQRVSSCRAAVTLSQTLATRVCRIVTVTSILSSSRTCTHNCILCTNSKPKIRLRVSGNSTLLITHSVM